ncbi:MATE family efflux transporter [Paenibacillus gansuensis]|uniref:MATE family efflux transporter n=1 Tax=Paenibacillus gansuensis TaxID=306542 RepID=A0ABW5PG20_9BACL
MNSEDRKFALWTLAWPIFIEVLLQTLLGTVDTFSVSQISDDAVAVVGLSNQLFNALMTLFMIAASGAGILIAQRIGSGAREDARTLAIIALKVCGAIGLAISVLLFAIPEPIARLLQMPEELLQLSNSYISIAGGAMVFTALSAVLGTAIRSTGNTKAPMYIGIGVNLVHVAMNYAFIFGIMGFPEWGLTGVAVSTLISKVLAVVVLYAVFRHSFERKIEWFDLKLFDRGLFKEIIKIGWPLGVNMSAWVLTQLVMYSFLAMLGTKELAAKTYMNQLESFCFLLGYAFALAVQIQIAHLFGAGRLKEAYQAAYRALYIGLAVVMLNTLLLVLFGKTMLGWFTSDPSVIEMCLPLLFLNFLLQPGKMLNMAVTSALNAVGDTKFNMYVAMVSMWLVAVGCSWLFGVSMGWGIIGIYISMTADEYLRGVISLLRWRGKKFLYKKIANGASGEVPAGGAAAGV